MIDLEKTKKNFDKYVEGIDKSNELLKERYEHSIRVSELSKNIVEASNIFLERASSLAALIGLLHDIGKFEQFKKYNSFDESNEDHADIAITLLFDQKKIRDFIEETKYDDLIKTSIYMHNKLEIPDYLTDEEKTYVNILRDADKLDNMYRISTSIFNDSNLFTLEALNSYYQKKIVDNKLIKTSFDKALKSISYIFDINYRYSFYQIEKNEYLEKIIDKLKQANPSIEEEIKKIYVLAKKYVLEQVGE